MDANDESRMHRYLLWGDGAGLVNSFRSGKLYLGAGWNKTPFPSPKMVLDGVCVLDLTTHDPRYRSAPELCP